MEERGGVDVVIINSGHDVQSEVCGVGRLRHSGYPTQNIIDQTILATCQKGKTIAQESEREREREREAKKWRKLKQKGAQERLAVGRQTDGAWESFLAEFLPSLTDKMIDENVESSTD
jgi:hypothetical protein